MTSSYRGGSVTSLSSRVLKPPLAVEGRPVRVGGSPQDREGRAAADSAARPSWLAAEVDQILARAREEARAILEQAEGEAAELARAARQQGYDEGVFAARADWQRALGRLMEEMAAPRARLAALLDTARLLEDQVVLATAAALAEQVVGEALSDAERLWARARALAGAVAGERVTLYCAPEVYGQLALEVSRLDSAGAALSVVRDTALGPADLMAEGEGGGADGSVLASLRHMLEEVQEGHEH